MTVSDVERLPLVWKFSFFVEESLSPSEKGNGRIRVARSYMAASGGRGVGARYLQTFACNSLTPCGSDIIA